MISPKHIAQNYFIEFGGLEAVSDPIWTVYTITIQRVSTKAVQAYC